MATYLTISRDTSTNSHYLHGYKVSLGETDAAPHALKQTGPVFNNQITYDGVFATRGAAVEAALNYIDMACAILQTTDHLTGYVSVAVAPLGRKARSTEGTSTQILGSRTSNGMFLAAEAA